MDYSRADDTGRTSSSQSQSIPSPATSNYRGRVRTGCLVCRARKVKCDEQRPTCHKCLRLNRTCVYRNPVSPLTPTDSNRESSDCQHNGANISSARGSANAPPRTEREDYSITERSFLVGNSPESSDHEIVGPSSDIIEPDEGLTVSSDAKNGSSSSNHQSVDNTHQGGHVTIMAEPASERFQKASQLIYLSTTMDWLAASDAPTPSSFSYFIEAVECPFLSPFDHLNWMRIKIYIAQLGLEQESVAKSLFALQVIYRAQVDRLPMSHAMSVYHIAVTSFDTIAGDDSIDFHIVLIVAFLLCLSVVTLPNEDAACFSVLDGAFMTRLEEWFVNGFQSPVSLRICAWIRLLNTCTKRPGSPGLLSEPICRLMHEHFKETPNLSELDRTTHPEKSLYDIVSNPVFAFYLEVQRISNRVADITHYRRTRTTPADQAEVVEIAARIKSDMFCLWESRPAPLRIPPHNLRRNFSVEIADPLITLAGVCITSYHTEIIVLGRILADPPFLTPAAKHAKESIRDVVDGDWNIPGDGGLNPGYLRPLFVYALESFYEEETQWAADRLRQIKDPISRSRFVASFVEAHGEAQRVQGRRVTMKYFCYQTFGVPLPFM